MSKKFVASYSGGKDSVLAIYKAMQQGLAPLALITTFNTDRKRFCFHGIPKPVLKSIEEAIGVPVWYIETGSEDYIENYEKKLRLAKEQGAEVCVFGDIDIEGHLKWCTERCENTGIEPLFPLCGHSRESVAYDFIDSGFKAFFTNIDISKINEDMLGRQLTKESLREITAQGVDICGENGEYHTFVTDGPIFKKPVEVSFGEIIIENNRALLPLEALRNKT